MWTKLKMVMLLRGSLYLLPLILFSMVSVLESRIFSANDPTARYELKFQADFDNSSIHKREYQQQIFKCQVRLALITSSTGSTKTRPTFKSDQKQIPTSISIKELTSSGAVRSPENVSIEITWLHNDQQLSNAMQTEPIAIYNVELHSGNSYKLDKKNKTRLEIKNTLNGSQLKLTSRLKISHLKPTDSGQYKCLARASFLMPTQHHQQQQRPSELIQTQQTLQSNAIHLFVVPRANGSISRLVLDHGSELQGFNLDDSYDNNSKATISGRRPYASRTNSKLKQNVESVVGSKLDVPATKWPTNSGPSTQSSEENIFEDDEDLFKIVQQDKNRLISGLKEQFQINEEANDASVDESSDFSSSFTNEESEKREHMSNEVVAEEFLPVSSDSLYEQTSNESVTKPINKNQLNYTSSAVSISGRVGKTDITEASKQEEITFSDNHFLTDSLVSTRLELVKLVHRIAKLSCYTGLGEHYHGNVSISADLRPCFSWFLFRHSHHLINSSLTKLQDDKNHCRNPNLDPRGPWCFVRYIEQFDGSRAPASPRTSLIAASSPNQAGVRFIGRPCAISPCSRYLWLYIVAPPLGLLLVISCLMMLIIRSIRKARYNTVFASNTKCRHLSKLHQIFLHNDRKPMRRFFGSHGDNKRDKHSDEDTFEIVDDLDWSDGQAQSLSPKSCQSLKLDSYFSSNENSQNTNSEFSSKSKINSCKTIKTVLSAKGLDQFHGSSSLISSNDTPPNQIKLVEPMFATLRCMVRNNSSNQCNSRITPLHHNRDNLKNKCSTFNDQSSNGMIAEVKDESSSRKIDLNSSNLLTSSPSNGKIFHKSPSSLHLISYSNTSEDINSISIDLNKAFKISDLPKLDAEDISIAVHQPPIFEGMFNQVRYAFVNVDKVKSNMTGRIGSQVAVCSLKANAVNDLTNFDMSEVKLNHLNHLNILKLVGYMKGGADVTHSKLATCLVYDMSHLVDLTDWLKQHNESTLTCTELENDSEIRGNLSCFAKQIALAIDYLHDSDIIFKDLACRNCFLDPTKMLIKLASFNIELLLTEADEKTQNLKSMIRPKYILDYYVIDTRPSNSQLLPLSWVPLETILFNKFNKQTDVWSLGCLIYELFSLGEVAFFGYSSKQIIDSVRSNAMPPQPLLCPNGIYKLMCKCLSDIPSMRPDIKQIYEQLNLYSGQCSSFLDHHLCSLDTTILGQPMSNDRLSTASSQIKTNNGSISKTKSYANLKYQSVHQTTNSSVEYDTPLPLSFSKPEVVKIPLSKSINLTGSRLLLSQGLSGGSSKQQVGQDMNQYDEPLVSANTAGNIAKKVDATSREADT